MADTGPYDSPEMQAAQSAAEERESRMAHGDRATDPDDLASRLYPTMQEEAKPNRRAAETAERALYDQPRQREFKAAEYETPELGEVPEYESIDDITATITDEQLAQSISQEIERLDIAPEAVGKLQALHEQAQSAQWAHVTAEWQQDMIKNDMAAVEAAQAAVRSFGTKGLVKQLGPMANSPELVRTLANMQREITRLRGR
jgi:hypothetical protein